MKCPNCDFIERDELFGTPPTCPKCGAIYEKALRVKALRDQQEEARRKKAEAQQAKAEKAGAKAKSGLAGALKGAAAGVSEVRAARKLSADDEILYTASGERVIVRREKKAHKGGCLPIVLSGVGIIVFVTVIGSALDSYRGYASRARQAEGGQGAPAQQAQSRVKAADDSDLRRIKIQRLAKEGVKATLHDPDTARFRNQVGGCGEVNAKNLFGGYAGYRRFMYGGPDRIFMEGDPALEEGAFDDSWRRLCAPGGELTFSK